MYRRMLFIGLGGSGGKTLRVLKRDLKEWLKDLEWTEDFPIGWQFLHIDTPSVPDGIRRGGGSLDDSEYLGLIGDGVGFDAVSGKIDKISGVESELLGWRVDGQALKVPLMMGAGQFRAIGRAIAMCYAQPIKDRLSLSINRLNNPAANAELASLYTKAIGTPPSVAAAPPIAIVVSSLAGGTGAGLLVDVCDILRALEPTWGGDSIAMLYTPEVFLGLGDGAVGGVQPNSLAAISEVLNGYWWHGGTQNSQVPRKSLTALKAAGLANDIPNSGPFCSYLVGSTSAGGVQYTSDLELFETVGAALVSWATDVKVQQNFIAHTIGNWQAAAKANQPNEDVLVNHGAAAVEPGVPAFSALGFSRVSLGTKYLERYTARRLAKDAVLHLANAHLASAEAQAMIQSRRLIDPEQIVDEIAERYVSWFLERSALEERGPDKNQILDMLTPEDSTSEWTKAVNRALELASLSGSHPASAWIETIDSGVEQATLAYHDAMTKLVQAKVKDWLKDQPNAVMRVTEDIIARFGLKVAAAIVMKAANVLSNPATGVVVEVRAERDNFQSFAQTTRWQEQVRLKLDASNKSKFAFDHPSIREAVNEALRYSICVTNAHICDRAAALIGDFATGFLKPLARAIEDSSSSLQLSIDEVNDWPNWGSGLPPADLCPPKSEWTLIEPEEFAEVFDKKLAETFAGDADRTAVQDHKNFARADVISGEFIRKLAENSPDAYEQLRGLQLLTPMQSWSADFSVSQEAEPRRELVLDVKVMPEEISDRAVAWLRRAGTPFQLLLSTDLRSYTAQEPHQAPTATPSEYKSRQSRMVEKLTAAIASASPLVGIDQTLIGQLHPKISSGGSIKIKRDVSEVPFLAHELATPIEALLNKTCYEGRPSALQQIIVGTAKVPHIDVVSQLDSPVSPLVVKSLMQPIANSWTAARSSGVARGNFWSNRRARTLREFVPVPQEHLAAMIRGWFTGKLLQVIKGEPGKAVSIVLDVNDPTPRWVTFPDPTLTEALDHRDQLPALLESLTLAYAAVGTVSSLEPLAPYIALRDYGSSNPSATAELYSYRSLNPTLRRWLQTGEVVNATAIPGYQGPRANLVGVTEQERRSKLEEFLNNQIRDYSEKYEAHLHHARRDPSVLGRAPFWPAIKDDIVAALDQLKAAVSQVTDESDF